MINHYQLKYNSRNLPWLEVEYKTVLDQEKINLLFPSWRPGRYEEANFLKKVKNLRIWQNGNLLKRNRTDVNVWEIEGKEGDEILVKYFFYADELNAGSTFCGGNLFYVNPVNCCIYREDYQNKLLEISLDFPKEWELKGSLQGGNGNYKCENIHQFFDTPFFASNNIQSDFYEIKGVKFNIHFWGHCKPKWDKIKEDFLAFTAAQIKDMGSFTCKEYHYLYLMLNDDFYHGVEHLENTVIALGPGYQLHHKKGYNDFLGVSSHELYHTYCVKTIRPSEWVPYQYNKRVPSYLGFLAEGVTTFMGDYYLLKSEVWDKKTFAKEWSNTLTRYVQNFGRYNQSVADSGYENWLDGYEKGVPSRKVSIYNEGSILALSLDYLIRKNSQQKNGLVDFMKALYQETQNENYQGVSKEHWLVMLEKWAGEEGAKLYEDYYFGTSDYRYYAYEILEGLGFTVEEKASKNYTERSLGMKMNPKKSVQITDVFEGGYAWESGLQAGDEIVSVNGIQVKGKLNGWLEFFHNEKLQVCYKRGADLHICELHTDDRIFYKEVEVKVNEKATLPQRQAYNKFLSFSNDK